MLGNVHVYTLYMKYFIKQTEPSHCQLEPEKKSGSSSQHVHGYLFAIPAARGGEGPDLSHFKDGMANLGSKVRVHVYTCT